MDYNNNLGHLLNKAARVSKCAFANKLYEYEITPAQWGVLKDVLIQEELNTSKEERIYALTPAAIADRIHADRPTVSGMIERLVKQQLVIRVSNPKDRRSQMILLTDKAKALMPQLEALSSETMNFAVRDFCDDEVKQLKAYLKRIIENLT